MRQAPTPLAEQERLRDLQSYSGLDRFAKDFLSQTTTLASRLCDTPSAGVSFVGGHKTTLVTCIGIGNAEIERDDSFCAHTILRSEFFVVDDASADIRFFDNAYVRGGPCIRFYAGAAFRSERGHALGALFVTDYKPRTLTALQLTLLRMLASRIGEQLELRRATELLRRQARLLDKTQRVAQIGGWEVDWQSRSLTWTDETYRIHGVTRADYVPTVDSGIAWYTPQSRPLVRAAFEATLAGGPPYDLELQIVPKGGTPLWVRSTGQLERVAGLQRRVFGIFQDINERKLLEAEVVQIADREQKIIGSTLHDGLGRDLSGMSFLAHEIDSKLRNADSGIRTSVEQLTRLIDDAVGTCRSLARGLSPVSRERGGLILALRALGERIRRIHGTRVVFRCSGQDWAFDGFVAEHIYRIVQEATNSALKRSRPDTITISLRITPSTSSISISDNGCGGNESAHQEGMALQIIRYRARLIGGRVSIESNQWGGTRIRCRIVGKAPG